MLLDEQSHPILKINPTLASIVELYVDMSLILYISLSLFTCHCNCLLFFVCSSEATIQVVFQSEVLCCGSKCSSRGNN